MRRSRPDTIAAGEGEGDDSPRRAPGRARRRGDPEPRAETGAGPNTTGSESLRHELRRWGLCRTFVHQFRLIARRVLQTVWPAKRHRGRGGVWRPYRMTPKHVPGLAAVKHVQEQARPPPAGQHIAPVIAVDCGWPESMRRELHACRTGADHLAWSERWAEELSGRAARWRIAAAMPQRPAGAPLLRPDDRGLAL
jgi:hypothetical protein